MTDTPPKRRPECPHCLRPQVACICGFAAPVSTALDVLVLQHPLEVREAKGTARLLHLSLPGSTLAVGEAFDADALDALLHGGGRQPVLLYPQGPGAPAWQPGELAPSALRLVILDGTWRKSRKMLHLNPMLAALPRLALDSVPPSAYRIRKAHAPHQLSTLEAAACALARLDPGADLRPLLDGFHAFVSVHSARAHTPTHCHPRESGDPCDG